MNKLIKRFRHFQKKHNLKHDLKYIKTEYHNNIYLHAIDAKIIFLYVKNVI